MAINFPNNPSLNQMFNTVGITYIWNGKQWIGSASDLIAGIIDTGIVTTSSISPETIISISASTYRSVQYQVQVTEGTNYNITNISLVHDGVDTYMSEHGTINQPIGIATFSSDINGGAVRLIGYPAFASSTTFKVIFTAIES
jgi:hypothetical protein